MKFLMNSVFAWKNWFLLSSNEWKGSGSVNKGINKLSPEEKKIR